MINSVDEAVKKVSFAQFYTGLGVYKRFIVNLLVTALLCIFPQIIIWQNLTYSAYYFWENHIFMAFELSFGMLFSYTLYYEVEKRLAEVSQFEKGSWSLRFKLYNLLFFQSLWKMFYHGWAFTIFVAFWLTLFLVVQNNLLFEFGVITSYNLSVVFNIVLMVFFLFIALPYAVFLIKRKTYQSSTSAKIFMAFLLSNIFAGVVAYGILALTIAGLVLLIVQTSELVDTAVMAWLGVVSFGFVYLFYLQTIVLDQFAIVESQLNRDE